MDNEVVKKRKINTLKTEAQKNRLENSYFDYLHSHKSIQHRQTMFGEKNEDVDKKISDVSGLVATTVLNTKIIGLMKKQIMMPKPQKLRENIPLLLVIMNLRVTYLMQGK